MVGRDLLQAAVGVAELCEHCVPAGDPLATLGVTV